MNSYRPGTVVTNEQQKGYSSTYSPHPPPPRIRSISPYSRSSSNSISSHNSKSRPASPSVIPDPNVSSIYPGQKKESTVKEQSSSSSSPLFIHNNNRNSHLLPPPPSSIDRRLSTSPQQPQRFSPKHDPVGSQHHQHHHASKNNDNNRELSPLEDGALQFVPAFEEAASGGGTRGGGEGLLVLSLEEEAGASWDAIFEEKKEMMPDNVVRKPATVANVGSSNSINNNKSRKPSWQPQQQSRKYDDVITSVSAPSPNGKGSSRISSRIASLFSSRSTAQGGKDLASSPLTSTTTTSSPSLARRSSAAAAAAPPSPSYSSSSSGYVGWPGTQDKRGATVAAVQSSSYDDSSVQAPASMSSAASSAQQPHSEKLFERELQAAAEQEMGLWDTTATATATVTPTKDNSSSNNSIRSGISTKSCLPSTSRGGGGDRETTTTSSGHGISSTPFHRPKPFARSLSAQRYEDMQQQLQQQQQQQPQRSVVNNSTNASTAAAAAVNDENKEQDVNRRDQRLDGLATPTMDRSSSAPKQCLSVSSLSSMRYAAKQQMPEKTAGRLNQTWNGTPSAKQHLLDDEETARTSLSFSNLFPSVGDGADGTATTTANSLDCADVWENHSDSNVSNSPGRSGSSYSKTSSAYLQVKDLGQLSYPDLNKNRDYNLHNNNGNENNTSTNSLRRSGPVVASRQHLLATSPLMVAPTADTLAAKDLYSPPHRSYPVAKGYRGLIEKTKEVPSLMDAVDESESVASSSSRPSTTTSSAALSSIAPSAIDTHPVRRNFRDLSESGGFLDNNNNSNSRSRRCQPYRRQVKHLDTTQATRNHCYRSSPNVIPDEESDVFDGISLSKESDVFDNLSNFDGRSLSSSPRKAASARMSRVSYPERIAEEGDDQELDPVRASSFQLVVLPGGLATIQTTQSGFWNRKTASDYDENLTNSDVDQYGFTKTPGFNEMLSAGLSRDSSLLGIDGNIGRCKKNIRRSSSADTAPGDVTTSESGSSLFSDPYRFDDDHLAIEGDLSEYCIPASRMKKVLRKYRKFSDTINEDMSLEEFEKEEDEHKAFALFEMRSRIMEKDIERGLERRGGTVPVDDIVTTPYHRTAYRIRDAVIVSKAWRDGASPKDVINTAQLTRRNEHTFYIKRPARAEMSNMSDNLSTFSGISSTSLRSCWWEPAMWVDDTDFMLYRCPSLGPRSMRGSEMFTIGDCQSMLLKLTNEQCINLRRELNAATKRQIEAEYLLTDEVDASDSMMTEAEMSYLSAMEEVKEISKKLVCAEQSFTLVRDRIQRLVSQYEHLLAKIDTESFAGGASSVVTYESSCYSNVESELWEEREKAIWARRAQRAELKAELAAREALLAKLEVRMIQEEKQRELEALHQRLFELQSESSYHAVEREHSTTLAKSLTMHRHDGTSPDPSHPSNGGGNDKEKLDDVKKRFRDRMAARKQNNTQTAQTMPNHTYSPAGATGMFGQLYQAPQKFTASPPSSSPHSMRGIVRSAGEEMYQQLDFYERSLKAVERDDA